MSFAKSLLPWIRPKENALAARGAEHLVTQVGYHYRFVASFQEMKALARGGRA